MKEKHPEWSDRQARCCLYWQGSVRKQLREETKKFADKNGMVYTLIPEAMGVNVIATARKLGVPIKAKPDDMIYKIALVGYSKRNDDKSGLTLNEFM